MEVAELADPRGGTAEAGLRQCRCDGLNVIRKRGKTGKKGKMEEEGDRKRKMGERECAKGRGVRSNCMNGSWGGCSFFSSLFHMSKHFISCSYRSFDLQLLKRLKL